MRSLLFVLESHAKPPGRKGQEGKEEIAKHANQTKEGNGKQDTTRDLPPRASCFRAIRVFRGSSLRCFPDLREFRGLEREELLSNRDQEDTQDADPARSESGSPREFLTHIRRGTLPKNERTTDPRKCSLTKREQLVAISAD